MIKSLPHRISYATIEVINFRHGMSIQSSVEDLLLIKNSKTSSPVRLPNFQLLPISYNHPEYILSKVDNQDNSKKKKNSQTEDEEKKHNDNDQDIDIASVSHGIYEKVDGSLGISFYCEYSKQWRIITRGHFGSKQAQWAMKYIQDIKMDESLTRGHTYLFEIVYPENRIGVDYGDFEGLILLHAYNENGY